MHRPIVILAAVGGTLSQQACNGQDCVAKEVPLKFPIQKCTSGGGCATDGDTYLTMDANWRWLQESSSYSNCWDEDRTWISDICKDSSDQLKCAQGCMLEGVDYGKYGVTVENGNSVTMKFMGSDGNIGSRMYLLDKNPSDTKSQYSYKQFSLLGKEFTFTFESTLSCGINGPIYFTEMDKYGDMGPSNTAGALYGTGYCDAQCPGDMHFVKGKANIPIEGGPNKVTESAFKACCNEMDLWEANNVSTAYTPHPCQMPNGTSFAGTYACTGSNEECRKTCDHAGCDFASYRLQYFNTKDRSKVNFWGNNKQIDATQPVSVTTQFVETDGKLSAIRRVYKQNGKIIQNMNATFGAKTFDSVTDEFCSSQATTFDQGEQHFSAKGGLQEMGKSLERGMTLVLSLWDDVTAHMLWLDGLYPTNASTSTPGAVRGSCDPGTGPPMQDPKMFADKYVKFSDIKWGDIGSTL
eukprot:TRINITY_DN3346_c0_g1_i1.p1 TRINITY_DN3346_c0_g1~~TRINITY_DN3346_c0_g1_i1.p1  ORF type:complete len:466 (+),score=109.21 TRINITY_DN3346_c0_g1_i1:46-1443(+)